MVKVIIIKINICPRCFETHETIKAMEFKNNPINNADYWASCPTTGEPVLIEKQKVIPTYEPGPDDPVEFTAQQYKPFYENVLKEVLNHGSH